MSAQVTPMPPTNLSLVVPSEMNTLVTGSDRLVTEAESFVVDSEVTFQLADEIQNTLKDEAKTINSKRLDFTRPLDALKTQWMEFFRPAVDGRTKAAAVYQGKMSAYSREQRAIAEAAQRQAEELARKEREKLEAQARERDEAAAKLKTRAGREKAAREAEELRQTAQMMPETFAVSAPAPATVASNVAQVWKGEVSNVAEFLQWLATRPEWFTVLDFKPAELNRMAKQFSNTLKVPGTRFYQEDSFRSKGRR